ncbi:hypothetical protein H4Q26_014244 [Puccinia striiformis f. sp. tritici PST-130]|nr:hypothetical protein H4Q26_014244 [Puccinia striiformis f. sp. tritici PST-130]
MGSNGPGRGQAKQTLESVAVRRTGLKMKILSLLMVCLSLCYAALNGTIQVRVLPSLIANPSLLSRNTLILIG